MIVIQKTHRFYDIILSCIAAWALIRVELYAGQVHACYDYNSGTIVIAWSHQLTELAVPYTILAIHHKPHKLTGCTNMEGCLLLFVVVS